MVRATIGIGQMTGGEQGADLDWRDGIIPVSRRFDDPYFSLNNGLAETRHVFLAGNDLPGRFCDGFAVAELGFGTGLNLLATLLACDGQRVSYTSFEAWPMTADDMVRALAAFPEAAAVAGPLLDHWATGTRQFHLGTIAVEVIIGDVQSTLADWPGQADAWYLDGFSPAKNPDMWSPGLMAEVGRHTAPSGTFATYTAAGHVRASLAAAGFMVERVAGHGAKRHMTRGRR
jgi:tRNA U34 5-methylaminomethyl-2-thiouridine-forming methyltransferase MnmC